jgi:putative inorganic carbon (HCO3(-)) transporter
LMDIVTKNRAAAFLDRSLFLFFIVLTFFLPISNTGIELFFGLILFGMIVKAVLTPPSPEEIRQFFSDRINLAVLVFYIFIGLSLMASGPLFAKSLRAWISKWGEGVLLFYFARIFLTRKQLKALLYVLLVSAFLVCIDGLYQKITGTDFLRGFDLNSVGDYLAVRATFSHYNDFATFLVVLFFINLGMFAYAKKVPIKGISAILALMIIVNMLFTYSRGSWVAFFTVCLFLVIFIANKKVKVLVCSMLAVFLLSILIVPTLRERFAFIVQKGGDAGRFAIWSTAISIFKDSPLIGCGVGLFMDNFSKYGGAGYQYAHNCYLQILAETGILGLASFLWIIGETFLKGCRQLKRRPDIVSLGVFSGFLAFLIHAFFDTQLFSLKLSILFWLMLSFVVKLTEEKEPETAEQG